MIVQITLEERDYASIHDTIFNALNIELNSNAEIEAYWNKLPEEIKYKAVMWGVSDTEVRDEMWDWFEKNCK